MSHPVLSGVGGALRLPSSGTSKTLPASSLQCTDEFLARLVLTHLLGPGAMQALVVVKDGLPGLLALAPVHLTARYRVPIGLVFHFTLQVKTSLSPAPTGFPTDRSSL